MRKKPGISRENPEDEESKGNTMKEKSKERDKLTPDNIIWSLYPAVPRVGTTLGFSKF